MKYEFGVSHQPAKTLKVGDTFYEPTGALYRVSRNPSATARSRLLAASVAPLGVEQSTKAEPHHAK